MCVDFLLQMAIATVAGYDTGEEVQGAVISDQHDPSPLISSRQMDCSPITVSLDPCSCAGTDGVAISCENKNLDNAGLKALSAKLPPTLAIKTFYLGNNALFHLV